MRRGTIVALFLVVGALGAALVLRNRERAEATRVEEVVFPGAAPDAVGRIDVENLERGTRVTLEHDAAGRWSLTSPVPYPASGGMLRVLLQGLRDERGFPVAGDLADDPGALGLEPPRAVLRWHAGPDVLRLELGGNEVGGDRIYARAGERVYLLRQTLYNAVQVPPEEYRERRATAIEGDSVVAFRRRGALALEPGGRVHDLTLDAVLDPTRGWTLQDPPALLDPLLFGFLLRDASLMRARTFAQDDPVELERWGLADPHLTVWIDDALGQSAELRFGCREEGVRDVETPHVWYACRAGYPFVWSVDKRPVGMLATPWDQLLDTLLVRAAREEVDAIELGAVRVERAEGGRGGSGWRVAGPGVGGAVPADAQAVDDLLSLLEFARVATWRLPQEDADAPAAAGGLTLAVTLRDGRRLGGVLSAPDGGAPAIGSGEADEPVLFQRFGDALRGAIAPAARALLDVTATSLRARRISIADELHLGALVVRESGREARFERDPGTGRWRRAGGGDVEGDASAAFFASLESLLALEARAWIGPDELASAGAPGAGEPGRVAVELVISAGGDARRIADDRVELAQLDDGRVVYLLPEGGAAEIAPELLAGWRSLLH